MDNLINNAAEQHIANDITEITTENLINTFSVNIFAMFWITVLYCLTWKMEGALSILPQLVINLALTNLENKFQLQFTKNPSAHPDCV